MQTKFNSDNDLPLNKLLKFHTMAIVVRSVFEEDNKLYPQIYLDEFQYELETIMQLDRIEDSEEIDLDKTDKSKKFKICHYNYFDNGFKSDPKFCNRCDWGIKSFENFVIIHVNNFSYRFFMFDMTEEDVIEFINDFEPDDEFEAMLQYERIGLSEEEIDNDKTSLSYECMICRYWYFKVVRFKFESNTCNKCSDGCLFKSKKKMKF